MLLVIKNNTFYSSWPLKTVGVSHVREMYEKMKYIVTMEGGKMYLRDEKGQ